MEKATSKLNADLGDIKRDVAKIRDDIAVIRVDVGCIRHAMSEVRIDLRSFRNRQQRDFRWLFGALMFVALEVVVTLAKMYGWIH